MKLHEQKNEFEELVTLTAIDKHLQESAIIRDYFIVELLMNLANSDYNDKCVFKGGTSLSKCYPGSIERFSEDIDITFLGIDLPDKQCDKEIKNIEEIIAGNYNIEKIPEERSNRSKSSNIWFYNNEYKIKLEIGSSVRPDPYSKKKVKTYIQEYLEKIGKKEDADLYNLHEIELNVLNIERTFIDKLMSIKRHAVTGDIYKKARHIYDVNRLYKLDDIKKFLSNKSELKRLLIETKNTDCYYIEKRKGSESYKPLEAYNYEDWEELLDDKVKKIYENLHKELLYTDEKQNLNDAKNTLMKINEILKEIGE